MIQHRVSNGIPQWERAFEKFYLNPVGWSSGHDITHWIVMNMDQFNWTRSNDRNFPFTMIQQNAEITLIVKPKEGRHRVFNNREYPVLNDLAWRLLK